MPIRQKGIKTRAISHHQAEIWKQKVKFWYAASQNVCLHSWQCWMHPYTEETVSTNCLETILFGCWLSNVKDILPTSWLPEYYLDHWNTAWYECQWTVSAQSHKHVQCKALWGTVRETRQTELYIKPRLQKRFWWPMDLCRFTSKGDEFNGYKPILYSRDRASQMHLIQHSQTGIKGSRGCVAGEEKIL